MLDQETKRRIDTLRDILVGKLPSPESQVEQITTGLIYKFMYDMDQESIDMGGVASFFKGDFEKYSWDKLFDARLGGADKVKLYSDAIELMYTNANAPQLFRDIFKNSFLPFKDPNTLNMFIDEVNKFHYSHSEKLGDAFEYLLSFMDSQGDAGQFRTPRHIIDFIVEIVNPQKDETILDPACGTSGFLISSFKHILKQNTDKNLGDKLNSNDRKKIGDNLVGYDISPDMTRISLVNMYLNEFANPLIHEYDTLSSEEKWNEYFDVILANPPFFSPKGGIQPHSRFGVKSKRAEVLFVDYIMEHLKPNGRAGIIVPEGIIFKGDKAYKTLRKKLVEDCLVGVISLPAGVFQPYSTVKTSILILDKELNQKSDHIFFAKVENDGFSLDTQRTPISKNDLPKILSSFRGNQTTDLTRNLPREEVLADKNVSLSDKQKHEVVTMSSFDMVKLGEFAKLQNGFAFKSSNYVDEGNRIIRITNVQKGLILDDDAKFHPNLEPKDHQKFSLFDRDILISLTGYVGRVGRLTKNLEPAYLNQRVSKIEVANPNYLNSDYLFWVLNSNIFEKDCVENSTGVAQKNLSTKWIEEYSIPLPPIEVQQQIVDELEGYQKIIDGCRQVVENYKPTIDIDPSWEMGELGEICEMIKRGITPKYIDDDGIIVVNQRCIRNHQVNLSESRRHDIINKKVSDEKLVKYGDVLVNSTGVGTLGRVAQFLNKSVEELTVDSHVTIVRSKEGFFEVEFFGHAMIMIENQIMTCGRGSSGQTELSRESLSNMKIAFPKNKIEQKKVIQKIEKERKVIDGNKELIETYTQKIQDKISKVWGE